MHIQAVAGLVIVTGVASIVIFHSRRPNFPKRSRLGAHNNVIC
jgi:hypothetical protein